MSHHLLPALFRNPPSCMSWTAAEWQVALPQLKASGTLGHLAELLKLAGVDTTSLPPPVQRQLAAHQAVSRSLIRTTRWECGELTRAFKDSGIPVMLLKGASYMISGALPCRGRFISDVDILVPRQALGGAEGVLRAGNWLPVEKSPEDERFVREWQHQVPPFEHQERLTLVDMHHTVIASGGGHQVDVDRLFAQARPVAGSTLLVPSELDQCLIVAAHFLRSGSADSAFRDLVDFTELLTECPESATVMQRLPARAQEVGLFEALAMISHFASALFGTPVFGPTPLLVSVRAHALVPPGAMPLSVKTRLLRRWYGIATTRAAVPWRVMLARTLRRRLRRESGG